jgi:signal transduction histidine kinase
MASIAAPAADGAKRRIAAGPAGPVLLVIVFAGVGAAATAILLALTSDHIREPGVHAALQAWALLGFIVAGVVAWWRRPESRFGPLMIYAGAIWFVTSLSSSNYALPYTAGIAFDLLPPVAFLHVFLAFPTGRLEYWYERALVAAGYVVAFPVQLLGMTLGGFGPDNLLGVFSEPDAGYKLLRVQLVVLSGLCLAGIVVLFYRRRRVGRPLRRSVSLLVDSFALALAMIAFLFLTAVYGMVSGQIAFETIRRVTFFTIGLAPWAFLAGLMDARLARSAVGELFLELRRESTPADLRDAVARALRDPSVELAYWLPEYGSYADVEGREVRLPGADALRATTLIERDGVPVAALIHDASLNDEPELLDSVTAAAGIALENAQLHVELRARLEELRGSRARIVEVAQSERQRLERNLHDGAQQRLVALSLELRLLEQQLDPDPEARAGLERARREVATSLAELRELARGLHPAVVSAHGLDVALEQMAALAPVPVQLAVDTAPRLPEAVEVAAYYVVCECLANVGKYAQATSATVDVRRVDGVAVVEVVDDGVGGADTEKGTGLRGLADRVEALGGRLRVWSPAGGGTRVQAEIPCES